MSLVPAFQIGVWNAWIFSVFTFLHIGLVSMVFRKDIGEKMDHGQEEQKRLYTASIIWLIMILYSIFLPLEVGTAWLYTGIGLFLVGTLFLTFFSGMSRLLLKASLSLADSIVTQEIPCMLVCSCSLSVQASPQHHGFTCY